MSTFRDPGGFRILPVFESEDRLTPGASALIILLLSAFSWSIVISAAMAVPAIL